MYERKIFIRIITLTSIMLAIVGVLFLYEISLIKTVKPKSQPQNSNPVATQSANPDDSKISGPGGCEGFDQCLQYCQDHPESCAKAPH